LAPLAKTDGSEPNEHRKRKEEMDCVRTLREGFAMTKAL
jgi:hypothetical protein